MFSRRSSVNGDVIDNHIYTGPGTTDLPTASRVAVLGEFGGFGLRVSGHEWSPGNGFGYVMVPDSATLTQRYVEATDTLQWLIVQRGLSGSIYTQPTDVENEVNGLWTYDRQVFKMNAAQVRAANLAVLDAAGSLRTGRLVSLGVTTPGYTDRSLRHADSLAATAVVSTGSDQTTRQDATYWLRPGLADATCYSFESRNYPGQYLRHSNYRVRKDANDGTALFAADATFCPRTGHTVKGISLESYNLPGRFLRHINSEVYIAANGGSNAWDAAASWAQDTTWQLTLPWWRSAADLPAGSAVSLQVVTPGYTDRYLRHYDSLGYTEVVTSASSATLKADATFVVRAGLADASCYSFESRNYPGQYLRHSSFRIRKDADDGTAVFERDATFCAQPGRYGTGGVTLESYNIAAHSLRHANAEAWIATSGGPNPADGAASYDADVTWRVAAAWAP